VALRANPNIRYEAVVGDILDEPVAMMLRDCDFLFLATDSIQSRLVFNALVKQYMIPGVQVGAKVSANRADIFTATRLVLPGAGVGCLECANCIPAPLLQKEAISERENREQRYVDDPEVVEPSVITLNALSAAQAANDLMMLFTGLFTENAEMLHQMHFTRERRLELVDFEANPRCPDCGDMSQSRRARGDDVRLPCRTSETMMMNGYLTPQP
jgi:hypothetical protein